jgi:hypothetical protein
VSSFRDTRRPHNKIRKRSDVDEPNITQKRDSLHGLVVNPVIAIKATLAACTTLVSAPGVPYSFPPRAGRSGNVRACSSMAQSRRPTLHGQRLVHMAFHRIFFIWDHPSRDETYQSHSTSTYSYFLCIVTKTSLEQHSTKWPGHPRTYAW